MKWFYAPEYDYGRNLPQHRQAHGFVLDRATQVRDLLVASGQVDLAEFVRPGPVSEDEVAALHAREVVQDLHDAYSVSRAVEFDAISLLPDDVVWQAVVDSQLHAAGGTCAALLAASGAEGEPGWACNLSGGFHHARPDRSHGFCLINDLALAVARLRERGAMRRLVVIDLDVHQGDGNAAFFEKDEEVFTFSMHEGDIFPHPKLQSDFDVALEPDIDDAEYLVRLDSALAELGERCQAELAVYVAGTDVFVGDRLGSLRLTAGGIAERDRRVARFARERELPLVVLPSGGYSTESPKLVAEGFLAIAREEPR